MLTSTVIMSFNKDYYEFLLDFNFYILLVEVDVLNDVLSCPLTNIKVYELSYILIRSACILIARVY